MDDAPQQRSARTAPVGRTLPYVRFGGLPGRPAAITVLFILTAVYAAGSFLVAVLATVVWGYLALVESPRVRQPMPAPIPPTSLIPYDGDPVHSEGLRAPQRAAVVEHVRKRLRLSRDRAEMLDRLLADVGGQIFAPNVRFAPELIQEAGQLDDGPDGPAPRAAHFLVTSRGRVEISDFTATFIPDRGKPARLIRNVLQSGDDQRRWSALPIGRAIDELHHRTEGKLTSPQAAALLRDLRAEAPPMGVSWHIEPRIFTTTGWGFGTITYELGHGPGMFPPQARERWLLADGRSTTVQSAPYGVDPLTGVPYTAPKALPFAYCPGSRGAMALMSGCALLESILAGYLFVGAILLMRDSLTGALRHVRYLFWRIPLLLLGASAVALWVHSLREYTPVPWLQALRQDSMFFLGSLLILGYPVLVVVLLCSPHVRYYFAARGQNVWLDLRGLTSRVRAANHSRRGRAVLGGAAMGLVLLGVAHFGILVWCLAATPAASGLGLLHLLAAIASCVIAAVLWIHPPRAKLAHRGSFAAMLLVFLCVGATGPATAPLSSREADQLLRLARDSDQAQAETAIGALAAAGPSGQDALLRLLEGPEPPIGVDETLSAIGREWFDRDIRWAEEYRGRALWLTPEWIESISRAGDVARIAALEALGPAQELEPQLRLLLLCRNDAIRRRSAGLLLRINPNPSGVMGQLRRELTGTGSQTRRAAVASLTYLRPASDALLARIMQSQDRTLRDEIIAALLHNERPLSGNLLNALAALMEEDSPRLRRSVFRLMALSAEGRERLIQLSLEQSVEAQAALEQVWPQIQPIFGRLRTRQGAAAAARILGTLNQSDDESELAALTQHADDEVASQACIVLADGDYGARLGPHTFTLLDQSSATSRTPDKPQWQHPARESRRPLLIAPPPLQVTVGLLLAMTAMLVMGWILLPTFVGDLPNRTAYPP